MDLSISITTIGGILGFILAFYKRRKKDKEKPK